MKIGKYNFPAAKMSKNQRAYMSQLKRIFDEATTMGIDVDAQEFVEMYFPMKVTKEAIENVSSVTAYQMFNVASKQDTDRMYVDNFMHNLDLIITGFDAHRKRKYSRSLQYVIDFKEQIQRIIHQNGYAGARIALESLPDEVKSGIDDSSAYERYSAMASAVNFLAAFSLSGNDNVVDEEMMEVPE